MTDLYIDSVHVASCGLCCIDCNASLRTQFTRSGSGSNRLSCWNKNRRRHMFRLTSLYFHQTNNPLFLSLYRTIFQFFNCLNFNFNWFNWLTNVNVKLCNLSRETINHASFCLFVTSLYGHSLMRDDSSQKFCAQPLQQTLWRSSGHVLNCRLKNIGAVGAR